MNIDEFTLSNISKSIMTHVHQSPLHVLQILGPQDVGQSVMECTINALHCVKSAVVETLAYLVCRI